MFFDVRFHTKFAAIKKICAVLTENSALQKFIVKLPKGVRKKIAAKIMDLGMK